MVGIQGGYAIPILDCEQSLFCLKIPAGGAARKRVRYSSREPRAASRLSRPRYSRLEYRPRGFAVHPARILDQKRDCSQSIGRTAHDLAFTSEGACVLCCRCCEVSKERSSTLEIATFRPKSYCKSSIEILGCVSLGESENGFVIRDHVDSSTPKKRKIRKRIILS